MTVCTHCDKDLPDGLFLCNDGAADLTRILGRVRDTLNTAGGTLTNTAVVPAPIGGGGTGAESAGLPYSVDMSDRVAAYQEVIGHWSKMVATAYPQDGPAPVDTVRAGAWLRNRIGIIRGNATAGTVLVELQYAERRVISAADRNTPKITLGVCGTPVWVGPAIVRCDGTVTGRENTDHARCETCFTEHSARARITAKISEAWHILAPLPQIVKALNAAGYKLRYDTAKKWATRGKIAPMCDVRTRQEGHSAAAVLKAMQPKASIKS